MDSIGFTSEERFQIAVKFVLKHERGYADNQNDPGGPTNYGISLRFLKISGRDMNGDGHYTADDIKELSRDDAITIYRDEWWYKYGYDRIDSFLVLSKLFDFAVNMGQNQACKLLQRAVNSISWPFQIDVDGLLGFKTIKAVNAYNEHVLLRNFCNNAELFYRELVRKDYKLAIFLKGWLKRAHDVVH